MTPSELKLNVNSTDSLFFNKQSMKFFGDTMSNYGVRGVTVKTKYDASGCFLCAEGYEIQAYELYRKKPVKHGLKDSVYFDKNTFKKISVIK